MTTYEIPQPVTPSPIGLNEAVLVASGDSRLPANQICWPAQAAMELQIVAAFGAQG